LALLAENADLQIRLSKSEEMLRAMRNDWVGAFAVGNAFYRRAHACKAGTPTNLLRGAKLAKMKTAV
jgi:hypothetical protein